MARLAILKYPDGKFLNKDGVKVDASDIATLVLKAIHTELRNMPDENLSQWSLQWQKTLAESDVFRGKVC